MALKTEKRKAWIKAWRNKNKEKIKTYNAKYIKEHKEEKKLYLKIYMKNNRGKVLDRKRKYKMETRKKLMEILGGIECSKCYNKDYDILEFDHINNDGNAKRKEKRPNSWYVFYVKNVKQAKKEIQVLCANCHLKKTKIYMRKIVRINNVS